MAETQKGPSWRIIGKSVMGANHIRNGLPNQDAISWWPKEIEGRRAVLAVSDGHGSRDCFRSKMGAYFAVKVAETFSKNLLLKDLSAPEICTVKSWVEESFPKEIARRWANVVADAISREPFTREELKTLELRRGADARRKVVINPIIGYGATVLTVLVTEFFVAFLQLGDGDILVVSENGEVTRPLLKDERLIANETTSLCLRDAWSDFRVGFQGLSNSPPALILVATDGYGNSFAEEKDFLKIGPDILSHIRSDGIDRVDEHLESWLIESSQKGSGDDITLGIVCRSDLIKKNKPPGPKKNAFEDPERVDENGVNLGSWKNY